MSKQTFDQVGLNPALLATLDSLNYTHMTPIQALSLPAILKHRDVIGQGGLQSVSESIFRDATVGEKTGRLAQSMHARIGSASTQDSTVFPR